MYLDGGVGKGSVVAAPVLVCGLAVGVDGGSEHALTDHSETNLVVLAHPGLEQMRGRLDALQVIEVLRPFAMRCAASMQTAQSRRRKPGVSVKDRWV